MTKPTKPTAQKKLQGTLKKCRENKNEPKYTEINYKTKPPEYFNRHSKRMWINLLKEWERQPIVTTADMYAFEMLCFSYGVWREDAEMLCTILHKNKDLKEKKYLFLEANSSFSMCEKLMSRFGLTPSDRTRLGLLKKQYIDPLDKKMEDLIA